MLSPSTVVQDLHLEAPFSFVICMPGIQLFLISCIRKSMQNPKPSDSDVQASFFDNIKDVQWTQVHTFDKEVQDPPPSPIPPFALMWQVQILHMCRGKQKDEPVKQNVRQCLIPTSKVMDFISGMENGKGGFQCKFVKVQRKVQKDGIPQHAQRNTALKFWRYATSFHLISSFAFHYDLFTSIHFQIRLSPVQIPLPIRPAR